MAVIAMATVTDSGFDFVARDRFSNLFVYTRGHMFVMNCVVAHCVPQGRRFSIATCLICVFSSILIGIATIPTSNTAVAVSLFIVAIFGESVALLVSEFALAPPVHLHLMSERHAGLILVSVGESIIQLALRPFDLKFESIVLFALGYAMSFIFVLLYFENAPSFHGMHALSRGGVAAFIFCLSHCFLAFFLLGFGVSIKVALKYASVAKVNVPQIAFVYMGAMVFGCLIAQDIIRLSHDAFKHHSSSCNYSQKRVFKMFSWFMRFFIDGLVFVVVYTSNHLNMVDFMGILFCLLVIK